MFSDTSSRSCFFFVLALLLPSLGVAGVEHFEMTRSLPMDNGRSLGPAGAYELVLGRAHLSLDPDDPANAAVIDLEHAPRDADGLVRYQADIYLVRPVEPARGNGTVLLDIVNRGAMTVRGFNFPDRQFRPAPQSGDAFLRRHGFTVVGIGWQADVPEGYRTPVTIRLQAPRARGIEGLVRADWVPNADSSVMALGHWNHRPHEVSDPDDPRNMLTVRDRRLGERRVIPRDQWRFGHLDEAGRVVEHHGSIYMAAGFEKGLIYEAVYVSREPPIFGLGFTAVRDVAHWLEHAEDSPIHVERSIAYGASQSARFLRQFVDEGFNSVDGKRVLDGIFATVGGAGRGSFNHRFAQPSRGAAQFEMFFHPVDRFPFTFRSQQDPVTGHTAGLFDRLGDVEPPKVMQVSSSVEYWSRAASLLHTEADGSADLEPHPDVRVYHLASQQHFPTPHPPTRAIDLGFDRIADRHLMNPANSQWVQRALLMALDAWIRDGSEPPPSRFPRLADGHLVTAEAYTFPAIPGVSVPHHPHVPMRLDHGDRFASDGILDRVPPTIGDAFTVLVPKADDDGNDLGGLRTPEIDVPLATYTGWNWRDPETGADHQLGLISGAWFPFARTAAERTMLGDPRPSIAERYASREEYLGRVARSALGLRRDGFLLAEDVPSVLEYAEFLWDSLHATPITIEPDAGDVSSAS